MKKLLLLPLVAFLFAASSCKTFAPIDAMTMKPTDRCISVEPENYSSKSSK